MTAKDIQRAICRDLFQQSFVLPNYTPSNWFECDVFEITPAGFFREYEIKLSRHDFRNDAKKAKEIFQRGVRYAERKLGPTKHQRLASRDVVGPVQFWFVAPQGLLSRRDIPSWAGLLEMRESKIAGRVSAVWDEKQDGPRLHDAKIESRIRTHASGTCYWRMHRMIARGPMAGMEAA